jgi:Flp pilus assembly protein TadD
LEAGRLEEAEKVLERAVSMDPSDELARENLRISTAKSEQRQKRTTSAPDVSGDPQEPARP